MEISFVLFSSPLSFPQRFLIKQNVKSQSLFYHSFYKWASQTVSTHWGWATFHFERSKGINSDKMKNRKETLPVLTKPLFLARLDLWLTDIQLGLAKCFWLTSDLTETASRLASRYMIISVTVLCNINSVWGPFAVFLLFIQPGSFINILLHYSLDWISLINNQKYVTDLLTNLINICKMQWTR